MSTKSRLNRTAIRCGEYALTDAEREERIDEMLDTMTFASDRVVRAWAAEEMRILIEGRSPEQVEKMEREQGLIR